MLFFSDMCPHEYHGTRGRVQSPGFPGYRNNVYCDIRLHYNWQKHMHDWRVFLYTEEFDIEDNDVLLIRQAIDLLNDQTLKPAYLREKRNYTGKVILL